MSNYKESNLDTRYRANTHFLNAHTILRQAIVSLNLKACKIIRIKLDDEKPPVIEVEKFAFDTSKIVITEKKGYLTFPLLSCIVITKISEVNHHATPG